MYLTNSKNSCELQTKAASKKISHIKVFLSLLYFADLKKKTKINQQIIFMQGMESNRLFEQITIAFSIDR